MSHDRLATGQVRHGRGLHHGAAGHRQGSTARLWRARPSIRCTAQSPAEMDGPCAHLGDRRIWQRGRTGRADDCRKDVARHMPDKLISCKRGRYGCFGPNGRKSINCSRVTGSPDIRRAAHSGSTAKRRLGGKRSFVAVARLLW